MERSAAAQRIVRVFCLVVVFFAAVHFVVDDDDWRGASREWPVVDTLSLSLDERRRMRLPRSREWRVGDRDLPALVADMRSVMRRHKLSCLPANFVGVPLRVIVVSDGAVLINPRVLRWEGALTRASDETLSHFGRPVAFDVAPVVAVAFTGEAFLAPRVAELSGWKAECVQMAVKQF